MSVELASPPTGDSLIETDEQVPARREPFYMAVGWVRWLLDALLPRVQSASQWLVTKTLTAQAAAILATAIPLPVLASGLYRVSWYVRVTQAAGGASAVQVTLGWTEGAQALTLTGALLNGNLVTEVEAESHLLQVDRATSLTYAAAYVSAGVPVMQYSLRVTVEQVN